MQRGARIMQRGHVFAGVPAQLEARQGGLRRTQTPENDDGHIQKAVPRLQSGPWVLERWNAKHTPGRLPGLLRGSKGGKALCEAMHAKACSRTQTR